MPPYWRNITGPAGFGTCVQRRDWRLVLSACGIAHSLCRFGGREYAYVPPMQEGLALHELAGFEAERTVAAHPALKIHACWGFAGILLLPLLVWHGLRVLWWPTPAWFPPPQQWLDAGILDVFRVRYHDEWQRLVTALSLHADVAHLCGNLVFGGIFLALFARVVGVGRAMWLTLAGGVLGNGLLVLFRRQPVQSLGFSTALFACVGALAGYMALRQKRRREIVLPIAAAAALLAMLGVDGERTDYAAHVAGLCAGCVLGLWEACREDHGWPALPQWAAGILALLLPCLAWWRAFS